VTQAQFLAGATRWALVAAFAASVLFIVVYTAMAPWWRTQIGRALVTMDAGLALALGPSAAHFTFGLQITESVAFAWYFLASLSLVAGSTLWRTWIIYRAQRPRKGPGPEPAAAERLSA
jgi:predicted lysophospholipase L1 biosynthesis ABC-type transport system permease subunit